MSEPAGQAVGGKRRSVAVSAQRDGLAPRLGFGRRPVLTGLAGKGHVGLVCRAVTPPGPKRRGLPVALPSQSIRKNRENWAKRVSQ
jgi:hypothetical protein